MNAIINWLALNNTLMIKIGFSAIILLIVVYVFRFFFVPKVKEVSLTSDLSESDDTVLEKANVVKDGAVALSSEDVTKLQAEISTLKYKLKEAEAEKLSLATQAASAGSSSVSAASSAGLDMVSETNQQNSAAKSELEEKIKTLESRLSEYEIIAEDIAEISKLRQENEVLKAKIAQGGLSSEANTDLEAKSDSSDMFSTDFSHTTDFTDATDAEKELATLQEASEAVSDLVSTEAEDITSENANSDVASANDVIDDSQLLDDYVASKASANADDDDTSRVVITSDVEVTDDDKNALNEFEQFRKKKKG